ncbi:hypothetical protein IW146_007268 [Coemansia sp. RSA 922]|nr:hypothetical protein GGI14_005523 [Coemansia sp. S680]KAJ2107536.1 hypothetical protein IW146_007268 [Coemansia sp. RSA 922]
MANNNARVATALDQVEELELVLQAAHHLLDKKCEVIADQQRIINQQGQTLTEHDKKIAQLECTISKQQHTIARSSGHAHWLEHHLRQAVTIAGFIVEAPNGAATDNGAAPRNTNTDDDTRDGADPDDNDALDDADPNDDYVLDSDDAQENGNIQDNNVTQDSTDLDDDNAPATQVTDSPPIAKRPQVDQQIHDGSEQVITSVDLLDVASPFTIIDVRVLANLFKVVMHRQLVPTGMETQCFALELAGLEGFSHWRQFVVTGSTALNGLSLLLRLQLLQQFGPAQYSGAVVLGSHLCCVLIMLDGLPPEKMTNTIIKKMFRMVARKSLHRILVATDSRLQHMAADKLCVLMKTWVQDLHKFVMEDGGIGRLQEAMTKCNNTYELGCQEQGGGGNPMGDIANIVLVENAK